MNNLTVVINTLNEEKNIERVLKSVSWADEVIVCDMYSDDRTVDLAKKHKAKVIYHKKTGYVEPARNFAISKATHKWILILDADEEVTPALKVKILEVTKEDQCDFVQIPRKNMIFGKWIQHSNWWPDLNIRLFKKGAVTWQNEIHSKPKTQGKELVLNSEEDQAIIHHHYTNLGQYIDRLNRYSGIQAEELLSNGYRFSWQDLYVKPLGEFLSRYFVNQGYLDGVHGLALSLLQAFSHLVVYLKVWEQQKFVQQEIDLKDVRKVYKQAGREIKYWLNHCLAPKNIILRRLKRIKDIFD